MRKPICVVLVVLFVMLSLPSELRSCNIGVADGTVTQDSRPLLWKSRMWGGSPDNQVVHYTGPQYAYIGVRSGNMGKAMMGLNETGLCTGNTLVGHGGNGDFMNHILGNYNTVEQVRNYIQQQYVLGTLDASGCFPFIDAAGNAAIFEINHSIMVIEYDSQDADRDAQGLLGQVTRANEFHYNTDGTDDLTILNGRYESGSYNTSGLIGMGQLSARTIMHGDNGTGGYEFMRYGPGRSLDTIATDRVCSSMVVHGVGPAEDTALATMWVSMGQANYSVAVPTWVRVSDVPNRLANGDLAARANSLHAKSNETDTQNSTLPFESRQFDEVEQLLEHWRDEGVPPVAEMTRVEHCVADNTYSLLNCLDNTQDDNKAPTVVQSAIPNGLILDFAVAATDIDGSIQTYKWNFGDEGTSPDQSPSHTYDASGWYLVSCAVTDNDGVSFTDWQHYNVVPEPASLLLLTGGVLRLLCRRRESC